MRTRHLIYSHDCLKTPGSRHNDRLKNLPQGRVLTGQIATWKLRKVGRGVANVALCRLEMPRQLAIKWEKVDPATGLLVGPIRSVVLGFAHFTAGFIETVAFACTTPLSHQPFFKPECVLTAALRTRIPEQPARGGKKAGKFSS